ncbi:hypothetical protein [Actinomadura hibisca]|uniref:hypothetical protein n=1 Tax=Actinomadura hibisca TaxID=68565 RepID=UPI000831C2C1|nr:hypothetical protein [Actinomadura hibisca]
MDSELFERPVLQYWNFRRSFRITAPRGGVLARTVPVAGGRGRGLLAMRYSSSTDVGALLVEMRDAKGGLLLTVDRAAGENRRNLPEQPILVRAPDGTVLGCLALKDHVGRGNGNPVGPTPLSRRECLLDERGTVLAMIVGEAVRPADVSRYRDYFAPDGRQIGHYESGVLRIDRRLPWPLRALVVVSPLLLHIRSGG